MQADRWTSCSAGHVHWGALGAAGLLLEYRPADRSPRFLLAQRTTAVDESGTWTMPGGAIRDGETPSKAAEREAREEIVVVPAYGLERIIPQDCGGGWLFHIVHAVVAQPTDVYCGQETAATGWFTPRQMSQLPLHRGVRALFSRDRLPLVR